ncbi:hypothetical protein [Candidatus Entotheonella palauensis]|uniref:hypothetical protein n=1 Tax=Candidatus Entotheonella palauensis TaxID=93172 RepID=UPI000B7E29CF|nr:hypothetical protein [Candidatus Entotheonella palauensis]
MAYSNFRSLADVQGRFALELHTQDRLFAHVPEVEPSEKLTLDLEDKVPLALQIDTEKARSEMMVIPVLVEIVRRHRPEISLFSGIEFNVAPEKDLNGFCDFLLSRSSNQRMVTYPIVAIVEAKAGIISSGLPQCLAEMVAAQMFNANMAEHGFDQPVYGAVTTGSTWQFLKLRQQAAWLDSDEYYLKELPKLLGILTSMVTSTD